MSEQTTNALQQAEKKQEVLIDWLIENDNKHPDYNTKVIEMHEVEAKIAQLNKPKPTYSQRRVIDPISLINYR